MAVAAALATASACGVPDGEFPDQEERQSSVIGGTAINVATQRSLGLLRMKTSLGKCSASLISPAWAVTAAHCMNYDLPNDNVFSILQSNGVTTDSRVASLVARVGNTDIALAQLAVPNVAQDWPGIARTPLRTPTPAGLQGQTISCYGRGTSGYATPSGLVNDDTWRVLVKQVRTFDGSALVFDSDNGNNTLGPGDSGGPCLYNNLLAGADSWSIRQCADSSTAERCLATVTKILTTGIAAAGLNADYIAYAPSRANLHFYPLTLAAEWTPAAVGGNIPGYTKFDSAVHLRGTMKTTGTAPLAFTLPNGYRPDATVDIPITLCNGNKGRLEVKTDGTANVSSDSTWAQAQCLTSLDGVQFNVSAAGSTAITPLNGWGSAPPPFRFPGVRVASGIARLHGGITQGTDPSKAAFNLPAAARPAATVYTTVDLCGAKKGRIAINPSGDAFITAASGVPGEAACFTSLEGVTYMVAPSQPQTLTLLNSWKAYPFARGVGVTNINGTIRFQGGVSGGTTSTVFLLSAEMRPAVNVFVSVDLVNGTKGRLKIQPDGYGIVMGQASQSNAVSFTSLEGAAFGI